MKNTILILFLLGISQKTNAQTLTFDYDTSGNQIKREYCATCASYSKIANRANLIDKEVIPLPNQVKIYPNPTKDKVTLVWSSELGDMIQKIEYVAYNFTQYREISFVKRDNRAIIDLSDQPIGLYVVIFHLNTGEKMTFKILKH